LHESVEHEERPGKPLVMQGRTRGQVGRVGVEEADGVGRAFEGEAAGLVDEFLGEIEGGEPPVAERPEAEGHAAGAAAGLEEARVLVGKETLDEPALGRPEAEFVRGARVVDNRQEVVEIGANRGGGNFAGRGQGREDGKSYRGGWRVRRRGLGSAQKV